MRKSSFYMENEALDDRQPNPKFYHFTVDNYAQKALESRLSREYQAIKQARIIKIRNGIIIAFIVIALIKYFS